MQPVEGRELEISAEEKIIAAADFGSPWWNAEKNESNKVQNTLPLKTGLLQMRLNQKKQHTVNLS